VLHDQPNEQQTAMEFKDMLTGHVLLRGNGYAQILPGPRGPVDQLIPIHPDRVTVEKLPSGRLRYQVIQDDGEKRPFNQEDIFHLRGPSKDGITGMDIITYAADSFGLTLAAERYGGRFFRNDSKPGGVLRTEKTLSDGAARRLKTSWEAAHTGSNQHRVAILEEGLEWQQIGISPEQAQFLGTREFQAEDVCRWFRVPPHMVGLTSKATSWGSGIESMGIGFVTYTLMPWLTRWKQTISKDLIIAPETYFADFIVDGLYRGDIETRYNAYAIGRQWGWLNVNDIRRFENMNSIPQWERLPATPQYGRGGD
jgi:HK97 family phage portal protein